MNATRALARRPYPTRGSPGQFSNRSPTDPSKPKRWRLATCLIAVTLLALSVVESSAATTARPTGSRPASCPDATGARWHIEHFFFQYDSHGAVQGQRLPASGNRYVVNAGGTDCALAHKLMRRLTTAIPDKALTGRKVGAFFVPPGYGYLFQSPNGFFCAATFNQTSPSDERGDNHHLGYCGHLNHRGAFSWTAATPDPEKYKPR